MNFVIFDLETTGLSDKTEQIIEIAAKKVDHLGNTLGLFHKLVSLYKVDEVSEFISNLTNITNDMLIKEGEDIVSVMSEFELFIDNCILVAQNAKFDMSFLMNYNLEQLDVSYSPICIDTIEIAKFIYPNRDSYKLAKLVEYFDVDYDADAHHRADYDVEITTEVFLKQLKQLNFTGDFNHLLEISQFIAMTEKQASFLASLMGQHNHFINDKHVFSKNTASFHINYYLK